MRWVEGFHICLRKEGSRYFEFLYYVGINQLSIRIRERGCFDVMYKIKSLSQSQFMNREVEGCPRLLELLRLLSLGLYLELTADSLREKPETLP